MLLCPGTFNLVVVEGCPKSLKRYHKLMVRRIDWKATPLPQPGDDEDEVADVTAGDGEAEKAPNSCHLVWEVRLWSQARRVQIMTCNLHVSVLLNNCDLTLLYW